MIAELPLLLPFISGFFGALLRNIVKNNSLVLPKFTQGNFVLGFIGCGLTGGAVGVAAGNDPATAFFAGYTGMSLISKLMPQEVLQPEAAPPTATQIIQSVCAAQGVDADLAIRVATCESSLNPAATNVNTDGSIDRGLFQINNKAWPNVTDAQAYDANFSATFFCQQFKAGNLAAWNSSKTCWSK